MKHKVCIFGAIAAVSTAVVKLHRLNEEDKITLFEKDE
jgi:hypothetical protein